MQADIRTRARGQAAAGLYAKTAQAWAGTSFRTPAPISTVQVMTFVTSLSLGLGAFTVGVTCPVPDRWAVILTGLALIATAAAVLVYGRSIRARGARR